MTIKEINYFRLRDYHPLWCRFPATSTNNLFFDSSSNLHCHLTTSSSTFTKQCSEKIVFQTIFYFQHLLNLKIKISKKLFRKSGAGFGLFPFRSPLLRKYRDCIKQSHCFLLLLVLRCFTSQGMHPALILKPKLFHHRNLNKNI